MKLNPEELVVSSFDTTPADLAALAQPATSPWEPTPGTYCDDCPVPVGSANCW